MAKLTGVKTIDMVGGEITKVEYNGELYANVEGDAKEGDLLLATSHGVWDVNPGDFFAVKSEGEYFDNNDDERNANHEDLREYYRYFRKESTQVPTLESRVETLETKVAALEGNEVGEGEYRKVTDREPRVGDFVKFTEEFVSWDCDLTADKLYEINDIDSDGEIKFYDDIQDIRYKDPNEDGLSIYEKVGAEEEPLKVGDYAKIVNATYYHALNNGDIVELVIGASMPTNLGVIRITEGKYQNVPKSQLIKATEEEVAIAKKEHAEAQAKARWAAIGRNPNEFKVGDAVRYKKAFTTVTEVKRGVIRINQSNNVETQIAVQPSDLTLVFPAEAKFE